MAVKKEILQPIKYGFPNFTSDSSCINLCDSNKLIISDIWGFWDYVIKKNGVEKIFMSSLLEQAKFFYEAAEKVLLNLNLCYIIIPFLISPK